MRELTLTEHHQIGGGVICIDGTTVEDIRARATRDGVIVSMALSTITGFIVWGATASLVASLSAGTFVAPYLVMLGYQGSSAWNTLGK